MPTIYGVRPTGKISPKETKSEQRTGERLVEMRELLDMINYTDVLSHMNAGNFIVVEKTYTVKFDLHDQGKVWTERFVRLININGPIPGHELRSKYAVVTTRNDASRPAYEYRADERGHEKGYGRGVSIEGTVRVEEREIPLQELDAPRNAYGEIVNSALLQYMEVEMVITPPASGISWHSI